MNQQMIHQRVWKNKICEVKLVKTLNIHQRKDLRTFTALNECNLIVKVLGLLI